MNGPAIFCGVVRNGGDALLRTLQSLDRARNAFADSQCIIVTNDNNDNTDQYLAQWSSTTNTNMVISADGLEDAFPCRIDRICAARNMYMREVHRAIHDKKWLYVIVLDLDGPNEKIDASWFERIEEKQLKWDALFANQDPCYYDIYALRHEQWCPSDCWREIERETPRLVKKIPNLKRSVRRKLIEKYIFKRQYKIPVDHSAIPVKSAFGGLGIYRTNMLRGCWYGSRNEGGQRVCEHVALNEKIYARGGKLFILPRLVNAAPREHTSSLSGNIFPGF